MCGSLDLIMEDLVVMVVMSSIIWTILRFLPVWLVSQEIKDNCIIIITIKGGNIVPLLFRRLFEILLMKCKLKKDKWSDIRYSNQHPNLSNVGRNGVIKNFVIVQHVSLKENSVIIHQGFLGL